MFAQSLIERSTKHAAWSIFLGLLTAALGAFLIVYPLFTAKATTVLLGGLLHLSAITQFTLALHSGQPGSFFLKLPAAGAFAIIGIALTLAPMDGVEALTGLLGTLLLVQAGLATVTALQTRPRTGWGWFLVEATTGFALEDVDSRRVAM